LITVSTGIIFICIGLMMSVHTSRLYRHVRNPMISGVLSILL
jgi:hypothetical protein